MRGVTQHAEEVSKVHVVELTALKSTHSVLQEHFSKLQQDFCDLQQQHSALSAAMQKKNTEQHDTSVQYEVLIRENTRLIDEIKSLKDSLKEKDDDMRRNTTSHYDMLKQSMDEKNSLWNELRCVNTILLLEISHFLLLVK
jgi:chromosome segregation ATPase